MSDTGTPGDADKLLVGLPAIAEFLGVTKRQALHFHTTHGMPTIAMGRSVCARPQALREWLAAKEAASRARAAEAR